MIFNHALCVFRVGIYHSVLKNKKLGMDKVFLATNILPFLLPISVEPTLNIGQVGANFCRVLVHVHVLLVTPAQLMTWYWQTHVMRTG